MKPHLLAPKTLFLVTNICALLLCSCGKSNDKQVAETPTEDAFHVTDTTHQVYENPKVTEFKAFVAQLDSADATSATKAATKFKEIFTNQTPLLCDTAFVVFQALYDSLELTLSTIHQNDTTNYEPLLFGNQASVPKKLKEYRKNLQLNGFKISASEGVTYVEQDRNFLVKNFYPLISPVMKDYLTELQKENKEGFAVAGAITISPKQLIERTMWYEKFIAENAGFLFLRNCKNYQKAYLTYLLAGFEKTPLYANEETKDLSDFYINAYNYLISTYPNSQTAQLVSPYYQALKQKQTSNAQSILKSYRIKGQIYSTK